MIRRIQARRYRCFPDLDLPLRDFQILVGPNGSGKSSLFGAIRFLGAFVRKGLAGAVRELTLNPLDLVSMHEPGSLGFTLDLSLPKDLPDSGACYSVDLAVSDRKPPSVIRERLTIGSGESQVSMFRRDDNVARLAVGGLSAHLSTTLRDDESILSRLMPDAPGIDTMLWVQKFLTGNVRYVRLETKALELASPPPLVDPIYTGAELPWDVLEMRENDPRRHSMWLAHVNAFLPHVRDIRTVIREDDRHAYIVVEEESGLKIPSWMLSEGTLRLLALTSLAYRPTQGRLYLIEEPENGLHPGVLEALYQSLRSIYGGQVLLATHSVVFISIAEPEDLLCFSRAESGAVTAIPGDQHPILRKWQRSVSLGDLFATGVLQ